MYVGFRELDRPRCSHVLESRKDSVVAPPSVREQVFSEGSFLRPWPSECGDLINGFHCQKLFFWLLRTDSKVLTVLTTLDSSKCEVNHKLGIRGSGQFHSRHGHFHAPVLRSNPRLENNNNLHDRRLRGLAKSHCDHFGISSAICLHTEKRVRLATDGFCASHHENA